MHHSHHYETSRIEDELRIIAATRLGEVHTEIRGGRRSRMSRRLLKSEGDPAVAQATA
jgi:hypothetical protein